MKYQFHTLVPGGERREFHNIADPWQAERIRRAAQVFAKRKGWKFRTSIVSDKLKPGQQRDYCLVVWREQ